jgi:hypothetical protein
MIIPSIKSDEQGRSYFSEVEIVQTGPPRRVSAKNQDVLYWTMSESQPGYSVDYQPSGEAKVLSIFSGQMNLTASNGECRSFVRGDMVALHDLTGQGHMLNIVGFEPCQYLTIAMPGKGEFKS